MSVAIAAIAMMAAGAVVGAMGQEQQANAAENEANYNAQVANNNAQVQQQNARLASASGAEQAAQKGLQTRAAVGQIKAAQSASNIDVNTGSALDVRSSASELGELDALTIRSNAARQAYGYETSATSYTNEANLQKYMGEQAGIAGDYGAVGSLLGGASSAGSDYSKWAANAGASPYAANTTAYAYPSGAGAVTLF